MEKALEYLEKYLVEPTVVSGIAADDQLMADLPEWWRTVLLTDEAQRVDRTLQAWEEYRNQLPSVFDFLSTHLQSVTLLSDRNVVRGETRLRLLYELEKDGRTMYYAGGHPRRKPMTARVDAAWSKLPPSFNRFYDSFHNGWYYLASNSMGPAPAEDFFFLDDQEWGILDDIDDPGCDLKDLLAVYSNGMGAYVTISIEQREYGDVLWWHDRPPRLNIDAWSVMDAWTVMGLNK